MPVRLVFSFLQGLVLLPGLLAVEVPSRNDTGLRIDLGAGLQLQFALEDGWLLGLQQARLDDLALSADETCCFPILANEYEDRPRIASFARLVGVQRDDGSVTLDVQLYASADPASWADVFVTRTDQTGLHRDSYGFAHLRLPAEFTLAARREALARFRRTATPVGSLRWHLRRQQRQIAGWTWQGWQQHYEFVLEDWQVNCLRQVGTWELGGNLENLTLVNMRYRGLGGIEQPLRTDGHGALIDSFSTTEILPGAAGKQYQVSPVLPDGELQPGRNAGIRHRLAAWIAHLARGAGVNVIDTQWRPEAIFCGFPERQGDLRALTECFTGDRVVSQTDEEWFAMRSRHRGIPHNYLVLPAPSDGPWQVDDCRTRWMEMDQAVRDQLAAELAMVQYEVLPSVGYLWEYRYGEEVRRLREQLPELHAAGIRQVLIHNPGWINGGSLRRVEDGVAAGQHRGGGNCNVYDWVPLPGIRADWRALQQDMAERGMAYYVWLSGMSEEQGAFAQRVGLARRHWALNRPGTHGNPTYGLNMRKHNPADPDFLREFRQTFERVRQEFGYQGFWGDSAQNLMFSQLAWADGSGAPLQRLWWEELARFSRRGVGWMAESTAFPGQSCSIEVQGWEQQPWYFMHVCKWLRGDSQLHYTPEERSRLLFQLMACKGWLAMDMVGKHWNKARRPTRYGLDEMPGLRSWAPAYLDVLPDMRRPYVLPRGAGMLWTATDPERGEVGVLFPFRELIAPVGLVIESVGSDGPESDELAARQIYRLRGRGIASAFGLRLPPADERKGVPAALPDYSWPTAAP